MNTETGYKLLEKRCPPGDLTGGGAGKTRLAIAVASAIASKISSLPMVSEVSPDAIASIIQDRRPCYPRIRVLVALDHINRSSTSFAAKVREIIAWRSCCRCRSFKPHKRHRIPDAHVIS